MAMTAIRSGRRSEARVVATSGRRLVRGRRLAMLSGRRGSGEASVPDQLGYDDGARECGGIVRCHPEVATEEQLDGEGSDQYIQ